MKALCFDPKGKWLCSYSAGDLSLKLWKVGDSGFFAQLMGGSNKVSNQISLKPIEKSRPGSARPQHRQETLLETGNMDPENQKGRSKLQFMESDLKSVELVRENGQKEIHKIVK